VASVLCCALALFGGVGPAAASEPPALPEESDTAQPDASDTAQPEAPPQEDPTAALIDKGQSRYDMGDPAGAIEPWTQAYEQLPPTQENGRVRCQLLWNLSSAHMAAHDLASDVMLLKKARMMLDAYDPMVDEVYGPGPDAQQRHDAAARRRAEIDEKIAAAEGRAPVTEPVPAPVPAPVTVAPSATAPPTDTLTPTPRRGGKAMTVAGAMLLAFGIVSLGVMAVPLVVRKNAKDDLDEGGQEEDERDALKDKYLTNGRAAFGLLITSLVLTPTGVVLFAVGKNRQKRSMAVAPAFGPQGAGASLRVSF
jgi:hypothetical protein